MITIKLSLPYMRVAFGRIIFINLFWSFHRLVRIVKESLKPLVIQVKDLYFVLKKYFSLFSCRIWVIRKTKFGLRYLIFSLKCSCPTSHWVYSTGASYLTEKRPTDLLLQSTHFKICQSIQSMKPAWIFFTF